MNLKLIFWETTQACNLGCPHCRLETQSLRLACELDTDEAKSFISQAASFSKPILVFSGGEPLLRQDIYELIRYTTDLGLNSALATNATLISIEVARRLKASRVTKVAVSIYGASAQTHDRFCGKLGAFEKTLQGIENLRKAGIKFQINTTITKKNLTELYTLGRLALEQGAVSYHIFFLVPMGRAKFIEGDEISPREYEEAFNYIYDLQLNLPLSIKVTCAPHYHRFLYQRNAQDRSRLSSEKYGFGALTKGCLAGQEICFISHKGEVFGCGYLPIVAGDLKKQNLKTIWFGSILFKILRDDTKLQGKCAICEFKKVCGGCRGRAYAACNNYLEEEPKCVYQPLKERF